MAVLVTKPRHLPGGDDALAEHKDFVVLPGDFGKEVGEVLVGYGGGKDGAVVVGLALVGEEVRGRGVY